jgi:hypothetical protein
MTNCPQRVLERVVAAVTALGLALAVFLVVVSRAEDSTACRGS